jgi:hypothetical protein
VLGPFFEIAAAVDLIFSGARRIGICADRNCIWSPEHKGFCNVRWRRFRTGGCIRDAKLPKRIIRLIRTSCITAMVRVAISFPVQQLTSPDLSPYNNCLRRHSRIAFAVDSVLSVARFGASRGARAGKRSHQLLGRLSTRQMELIENSMTEQRLAMKVRSRLRVICATPFQKRADSHRSEQFLYCVCMGVR